MSNEVSVHPSPLAAAPKAPPPPANVNEIVDGFSPSAAHTGESVTINGRGFSAGDAVFFGGAQAGNVDYSGAPNSVKASVPADAVTGRISVGFAQSGTDFSVLPTITSFAPAQGTANNTTVVITGTGYHDRPVTVTFAPGVNAVVTGGDFVNTIGVTVPDGAVTGPITVKTKGGSVTSVQPFTVLPQPPQIKRKDGYMPTSGHVGAQVTIYAKPGTRFEQIQSVTFKGPGVPKRVPAQFSVLNQKTQIAAIVPQGAVTGPIRVTNATAADTTNGDFVIT